jgi:hypothetical protein
MTRGDTPLCPAGHLPLKGGDPMGQALRLSQPSVAQNWRSKEGQASRLSRISPFEGEMAGRPEGGNLHVNDLNGPGA